MNTNNYNSRLYNKCISTCLIEFNTNQCNTQCSTETPKTGSFFLNMKIKSVLLEGPFYIFFRTTDYKLFNYIDNNNAPSMPSIPRKC